MFSRARRFPGVVRSFYVPPTPSSPGSYVIRLRRRPGGEQEGKVVTSAIWKHVQLKSVYMNATNRLSQGHGALLAGASQSGAVGVGPAGVFKSACVVGLGVEVVTDRPLRCANRQGMDKRDVRAVGRPHQPACERVCGLAIQPHPRGRHTQPHANDVLRVQRSFVSSFAG